MSYIGNQPTTGHFPVDNFTSSGGSTYTLTRAPASAGAIEVSVQGVLQPTTAYTVSGTTLNLAGVTTGVKIFVRHLGETLVLPTIADGVVTTAKLGTNAVDGTKIAMGSDARGDILYHGATDYARLAKGTSGQILTMGANDPAWAAGAAGGAWTILATTDASGASSIDFTNVTSTYDTYVMTISDMRCSADGNGLNFRFGDSGGFDSASGDYTRHEMRPNEGSGNTYAGSGGDDTQIGFSHALGTGTGEGFGGIIYIHQPSDGVTYPQMTFHGITFNMSATLYIGFGGGVRQSNIVMDRFQIYPAAGTLTGRATVYGIAHA